MGDRSDAQRAQAGQVAGGTPDQRIGAEAAQELRVVVVEREAEPEPVGDVAALGHDPYASVRKLVREHPLGSLADVERSDEDAVTERPRRVSCCARGQRKGVRPGRPDDRLDHRATLTTESDGSQGYALAVSSDEMRATWDAAASSDAVDAYVGDPATAAAELDGFFGRLDADPRGGVCVEVGCGPGRMTKLLAGRFDRVIAVDVSPEMLERARRAVPDDNVDLRVVSGERLDSVENAAGDTLVCYLVLQHLPDAPARGGVSP